MTVAPKDLQDELEYRRFTAALVLDQYSGRRLTYADWKNDTTRQDNVLSNAWDIVWPDNRRTWGDPYVPNVPLIAVEDRTRLVAAGTPTIICSPESLKETAKKAAEKRERVLGGYWERSRVRNKIVKWAPDLMVSGVSVVKVFPDLSAKKAERFPEYCYVDPRHAFPGPMFTEGPFVDDMLVCFKRRWREVAKLYDRETELTALMGPQGKDSDEIEVIEYADDEIICVVAYRGKKPNGAHEYEWLLEPIKHKMGKTPFAIGVRPSPLHVYGGDFGATLGPLRTWNRMVAMSEDSAIDKVYPNFAHFDVANPQDRGPDADLELETKDARAEFISPPGEPFSNVQLTRQMGEAARAGALLPPARTGDPNESIISAAGISAANSQMADHVRSLQRDSLAPMFEAANELAFRADEAHGDVDKEIYGFSQGRSFRESYKPSKDINGNYRNKVVYGVYAGLDPINQSVLVGNQVQLGIISEYEARELSPVVEDPQRTERLVIAGTLRKAMLAGLYAKAANGELDAVTVARIEEAVLDEDKPLRTAISENVIAAPLAQPEGTPQQSTGATGIAGAEQPQGFQGMPALDQVMAGTRP